MLLLTTPLFWYERCAGPRARMLQPLGWLYGRVVALHRRLSRSVRLPVPVVSVGNITLGGTGKTPLVIALARELQCRGWHVAVLLRGYGSGCQAPCRVNRAHVAAEVGDEAMECLHRLPEAHVWVGRDRVAAGQAAIAAGATLLLLDDGLQHWRLARDCDITVLDRVHGVGNGLVFPAGPLREPLHLLGRADLLVLTGPAQVDLERQSPASASRLSRQLRWPAGKPILTLAGAIAPPAQLLGQSVLAFCGIGLPSKFFEALEQAGLKVVDQLSFPDHHPYDQNDLEFLQPRANVLCAILVTTFKDLQRLPDCWRERVVALPLILEPQAVVGIVDAVQERLSGSAHG